MTNVIAELANGSFVFLDSDEDIHTAVEHRLRELVELLREPQKRGIAARAHSFQARIDIAARSFAEAYHDVEMPIGFPQRRAGCRRSGWPPAAADRTRRRTP